MCLKVTAMNESAPSHGPLHELHEQAGAKFGEFSGWLMPLEYAGGGVVAEHTAVREAAGLFDVSHMGTVGVSGNGTNQLLQELFTNDLTKVEPGRVQYTLMCDDTGGVIDDLLVYVVGTDDAVIVPNAGNRSAVVAALHDAAEGTEVVVDDRSDDTAIIAIQGPRADDVLAAVGITPQLDYMSFTQLDDESPVGHGLLARTGYTGERGYELIIAIPAAVRVWPELAAAVQAVDGRVCGLGARDTLRTEMGYPLHGHELGAQINPVMAGSSWAVGWDKPDFVGKTVLAQTRKDSQTRRLRGLLLIDRGVPRPDMPVRASAAADAAEVGVLTSGTFSPSLKQGIALALLDQSVAVGDRVAVDVRGRLLEAEVVKTPFVPNRTAG